MSNPIRIISADRRAFTLVELMVVISIIGLLSTIAMTQMASSRAKAKVAAGQQFSSSITNLISDQIVGEWTFDAPAVSGKTADSSGKGNDGTLVNGPVLGPGYNGNSGYVLNGSNQYISMASLPASNFTNTSFTWSAWVKGKTNDTGVNYMPTIGFGSGSWFRLGFHQVSGIWHFDQILDGTHINEVNCGPIASETEWTFLAATAEYGGNVTCYKNGAAGATLSYINGVTSGTGFSIGHSLGSAWNEFFQGTVDDVRLYGSALTAAAIRKNYLAGRAAHPPMLAAATNP